MLDRKDEAIDLEGSPGVRSDALPQERFGDVLMDGWIVKRTRKSTGSLEGEPGKQTPADQNGRSS